MATNSQTAKDTAWNLMASLDTLTTVEDTEKGTTDSGIRFRTIGSNLPAEVMDELVRYDYCVDVAAKTGYDWVAVKES